MDPHDLSVGAPDVADHSPVLMNPGVQNAGRLQGTLDRPALSELIVTVIVEPRNLPEVA